jgi:hypothetical protein
VESGVGGDASCGVLGLLGLSRSGSPPWQGPPAVLANVARRHDC